MDHRSHKRFVLIARLHDSTITDRSRKCVNMSGMHNMGIYRCLVTRKVKLQANECRYETNLSTTTDTTKDIQNTLNLFTLLVFPQLHSRRMKTSHHHCFLFLGVPLSGLNRVLVDNLSRHSNNLQSAGDSHHCIRNLGFRSIIGNDEYRCSNRDDLSEL